MTRRPPPNRGSGVVGSGVVRYWRRASSAVKNPG